MIVVVAITLLALGFVNRHLARSILYPPALFAFVWAASLFVLILSGDTFYRISNESLAVYLGGAVAFSLGGLITKASSRSLLNNRPVRLSSSTPRRRILDHGLDICLVIVFLSIPFYWNYVSDLASTSGIKDFWIGTRYALVAYSENEGTRQISLIGNAVPFSMLVALFMYYEDDGSVKRKIRSWLSISASLVLNVMTAGRVGAVTLLLSVIALHWVKRGKPSSKFIAVILVLIMALSGGLAILLHKGDFVPNAPIEENLPAVIQSFQLYVVGGLVAFDKVSHNPGSIPAVWVVERVFLQAANKLGAHYYLPSLHAAFTSVGPGLVANVYTSYFAYVPEFGIVGAMLVMAVLGGMMTWLYRLAVKGDRCAVIVFSIFVPAIVLSGYGEQFFSSLNYLGKAVVLLMLLHGWVRFEGLFHLAQRYPNDISPMIVRNRSAADTLDRSDGTFRSRGCRS